VHTLVEKGLLAARWEEGGQPLPLTSDLGYVWRAWFAILVPDMPDRIIAATAMHLGLPLVMGDRKVQASVIVTIW
jgi:predicted nucleic acid-binding protein